MTRLSEDFLHAKSSLAVPFLTDATLKPSARPSVNGGLGECPDVLERESASLRDKLYLALTTVKVRVKAFDIRLFSKFGVSLIACVNSTPSTHIGSGETFGTQLASLELGVAGARQSRRHTSELSNMSSTFGG